MEFLLFQSLVLIPSVKKIQTILQTLALRENKIKPVYCHILEHVIIGLLHRQYSMIAIPV